MTARESINPAIPTLQKSFAVEKALHWMDEFSIDQLPMVEAQTYLGLVKRESLEMAEEDEILTLSAVALDHPEVYASENQHFLEAIAIACECSLDIVPVLSDDKKYIGAISVREAAMTIARLFAVHTKGGIFTLSVDSIHYSLAEISRIVEANNARVLSSFVELDKDTPHRLFVTLKVNTTELRFILASFERFNYKVIAQYHDQPIEDGTKERLGMLLKYLEM